MTNHNAHLRRGLMAASLIALSACASTYPARYTHAASGGGSTGGLSSDCSAAVAAPPAGGAGADNLSNCLVERAAAWERNGRTNRALTRGAGSLAIVSTAVGIALAAEGDPNHAVAPLGLTVGAAVTGARSYTAPEQAAVAEKAVAAYNCLLSSVAELRAGDNQQAINAAHDRLTAYFAEAKAELAPTALAKSLGVTSVASLAADNASEATGLRARKAGQKKAAQAQLETLAQAVEALSQSATKSLDRVATARDTLGDQEMRTEIAYQQAAGQARQADARLLKQSDVIDQVAIAEITKREPTVYAVASSARDSILAVAQAISPPPPPPPPAPTLDLHIDLKGVKAKTPETAESICASGQLPSACAVWRHWSAVAQTALTIAADAEARVTEVNSRAAMFDAAVKASKATDPQLGQTCVVAVTDIAPLTVSPTALTLSDSHTGTVHLSGGVTTYYADQPPKGWSVTLSPSGRADITAPADASGTQTLTFYDGSSVHSQVSVDVTAPKAKTAPAGDAATPPTPLLPPVPPVH